MLSTTGTLLVFLGVICVAFELRGPQRCSARKACG